MRQSRINKKTSIKTQDEYQNILSQVIDGLKRKVPTIETLNNLGIWPSSFYAIMPEEDKRRLREIKLLSKPINQWILDLHCGIPDTANLNIIE